MDEDVVAYEAAAMVAPRLVQLWQLGPLVMLCIVAVNPAVVLLQTASSYHDCTMSYDA